MIEVNWSAGVSERRRIHGHTPLKTAAPAAKQKKSNKTGWAAQTSAASPPCPLSEVKQLRIRVLHSTEYS